MENTSENTNRSQICLGVLAHVDAGKTTLAESFLYLSGSIRKAGRVDHKDAFLDTHDLERARGITIFSKQARFQWKNLKITLLDTPGHVDFSAEMERTLSILDYGVLVINGTDGIQGHTATLWKLLERYHIPVFLFINKMDQAGTDRMKIMDRLKKEFSDCCVDFGSGQDTGEWKESLALCDEKVMEEYLETDQIQKKDIIRLIKERKTFPCYFGSALKHQGIEELLDGLEQYTKSPEYGETFAARVYKISRDEQGNRLTHMKITGGSLKVKTVLEKDGISEKVDQIRLYSGSRFETAKEAAAGAVCAVTGLTATFPGQGLGAERDDVETVLEPVLSYRILLPPDCDSHVMLQNLRILEEEEPKLHIVWNSRLEEIYAQVMGEVQIEILKSLIAERFGVKVEFDEGNIVYKETIENRVEGVGHFEPLRHYAEVHLLMEPGERGSGFTAAADCSEDVLDRNWQRLVLTHLTEREHPGVLTGSPITDIKITLVGGKAHLKHTEGGDFRQATYRAVRQGLKEARCRLLEPWYQFRLEVPAESVGRAMSDIQRMSGSFEPPQTNGETAMLQGKVPAAEARGYQSEVNTYTKGSGKLFLEPAGYELCHNEEKVIEEIGYDWEKDLENPAGSVFCSHGAGYTVSWDKVKDHMHVESCLKKQEEPEEAPAAVKRGKTDYERHRATEKELEEIFLRTYGPGKTRKYEQRDLPGNQEKKHSSQETVSPRRKQKPAEKYLLVDGYNIIFAWEELNALAQVSIDGARDRLMDIMSNYQGYRKETVILVFDAYRVEGHREEIVKYHNIYVVYTKEAETADQYIEKTVHEIGRKHEVTVATSDRLEQVIIRGEGGRLISARELEEEIKLVEEEIRQEFLEKRHSGRNYLFDHLEDDLAEEMEKIRLGRQSEDI
ncbi:MAG: NYN domain-containing protein [Ruminococcus sp.]|jgi:ribosomal protection tetracycline resistance protein